MRGEVEVTGGGMAHRVLAFVSATTNITSEPSRAEVFVDGKSRGRTPLRLELPVRSHELTAHLDGWPNEQQKIDIDPQRENAVHFVFANGSVKITSAPGGAVIIGNGQELGQTPLVIEEVKPGDGTYELRLGGYKKNSGNGTVEHRQRSVLAGPPATSHAPGPGRSLSHCF